MNDDSPESFYFVLSMAIALASIVVSVISLVR